MSETQDTRDDRPARLRRFRSGGYGQMVEDERGAFIRHDDLIAWLTAFAATLRAYEGRVR